MQRDINKELNMALQILTNNILKKDSKAKINVVQSKIKQIRNMPFEQPVADLEVILSDGRTFNYNIMFSQQTQRFISTPIFVGE